MCYSRTWMRPMTCRHREGDLCSITCSACKHEEPTNCPSRAAEQRRLMAVLEQCPYHTHWRDEEELWCHAEGAPHLCFGWPEECPEYLRRQLAQYKRLFGTRIGRCCECGHLFLRCRLDRATWREKRYCCRRCRMRAAGTRLRKRRNIPERENYRRRVGDRSAPTRRMP